MLSVFLSPVRSEIAFALSNIADIPITPEEVEITACRKEFEGDYTFVSFNWSKRLGKSPESVCQILGDQLKRNGVITQFNVVKGFLNFQLPDKFWLDEVAKLESLSIEESVRVSSPMKVLIEYCSPNTNKPLHLGHIRNILVGWSVYKILSSLGHHAFTTQVINDRGIAICKSMLAWKLFANGATPDSQGIKGDHFVGEYYVLFENKFKEEYLQWQNTPEAEDIFKAKAVVGEDRMAFFQKYKNEYFNRESKLGAAARAMLQNWESGDPDTLALWKKMNDWVYSGFQETFDKLGVRFDSNYYESNTYLLGKDIVEEGLQNSVFVKDSDQSVWVDLTDAGLDRKIVLRSDGTSVYITQDLGTADQRDLQHHADQYIYVVADEQDYHFKVLKEILKKLKKPYADGIYHLNYGMVELPSGRMKSREGTVVDADDLIREVLGEATQSALERGELAELSDKDRNEVIYKIAMSALKYFILKVQAKKRMIFNPAESVDMQGHTGPYIANAYVRIRSILRRFNGASANFDQSHIIEGQEKVLIKLCLDYPDTLQEAGRQLDPAHLANHLYQLAKDFHKYYHDHRILNAETEELVIWRIRVCKLVGAVLLHGMSCLGIEMPDRM
ncbi:MAG: arginine--tRNA ligase [Saprospiraceae bacterium]|nr:arginine--tRNA ligase [Saprospiraceae bacterium]HMX87245.1 arginine--tRNA ligase [Saprospiraceae bacterium]HMZ38675.1 arginine--tRNA ligase [Saprospiraceae bacterium]HNA64516.1 arginine--tRNA ligase [Saprospiraceae bacterium]HNB30407.1 arginine--tRNA ligase [Saprospiraceae bacterium]